MLLPLAAISALGNCVFHPADLSILSTKVSRQRMGRAFAIHGFGGALGPLLFGWLMDGDRFREVFLAVAIMYLIGILSVLQLARGRAPAEVATVE